MNVILVLLLSLSFPEEEIEKAEYYILDQFSHISDDDELMILSVGAPEVIRYSKWSNFIESEVLEILYVKGGTGAADFSIGYFQMKPSFIERLEFEITNQPTLESFLWLTEYESCDPIVIRRERLNRIQSNEFSFSYLEAFYQYCLLRFSKQMDHLSKQDRLRFIATAYNLGFDHHSQDIIQYQQNKYFPYGADYQGDQFAYGDLSVKMYENLKQLLCL